MLWNFQSNFDRVIPLLESIWPLFSMLIYMHVFVHFRNRSKDIDIPTGNYFFLVFQDDGNDSDDFMWSKKWQTKCLSSISFRERMGSEVKRKLIKLLVFLIFIAHKQNLSQFSQTPAVSLKFIPLTCYCFL